MAIQRQRARVGAEAAAEAAAVVEVGAYWLPAARWERVAMAEADRRAGVQSVGRSASRKARKVPAALPLLSVESAAVAAPVVNLLSALQVRIASAVGLPVREVAGGFAESKRQAARLGAGRRRRERDLVEAFASSFVVRGYLSTLAGAAGRMAGRGAKVSATSIQEAGEAGRGAVLSWSMRAGGVGADGLPVQLVKAAGRPESVRAGRLMLFAKRAASASLRAARAIYVAACEANKNFQIEKPAEIEARLRGVSKSFVADPVKHLLADPKLKAALLAAGKKALSQPTPEDKATAIEA